MVNRRKYKTQELINLFAGLIILILINIIGSYKFERFDLTSEKRYSISKETKKLLQDLEDVIYVRIYLEGEFPAGFKRLRNSTKEMFDEFRAYANGNLEFEFINPSANPDIKLRNQTYDELTKQGLQPTALQIKEEGGSSQKIIFPGAIFSYREREMPLQLLRSRMGVDPEVMLNNSIETLEYEFSNTIRKLCSTYQPKIAFIEGHGELGKLEVQDITKSLSSYYRVERVSINGKLGSLDGYKAIIIAKPHERFSEKDKFITDQFIMNGGKSLWLIDGVTASMDSLVSTSITMGIPNETNLEDQLFRYGVRINYNLVQDLQSAFIPVNTAVLGAPPKWDFFPWIYFPLIMPGIKHPIVNNLNAVKSEFTSSIDTVAAVGITKTFLLKTSQYSRMLNAPVKISLQTINKKPDEALFRNSYVPTAVLMEGSFSSVFKNRIPAQLVNNPDLGYLEKSQQTAMIVIADGDIIRNQVQYSTGKVYPLGFDKYTGQEFGNKDFILNCVDYLCDDSDLIKVRSRELKLRLLDKTQIENNRMKWQLANTCLPLVAIILMGIVIALKRKRKYAS